MQQKHVCCILAAEWYDCIIRWWNTRVEYVLFYAWNDKMVGWIDMWMERIVILRSRYLCARVCANYACKKKLLFHAVTEILHTTTQHTRSLTALIHKTMCVAIWYLRVWHLKCNGQCQHGMAWWIMIVTWSSCFKHCGGSGESVRAIAVRWYFLCEKKKHEEGSLEE